MLYNENTRKYLMCRWKWYTWLIVLDVHENYT